MQVVQGTAPDMIFMSAQPHDEYFVWQVEAQIVNFREHGISNKMHVLVWYPQVLNTSWKSLQSKYPEVNFFFYKDQGANIGLYIPIIRPHILKKHFYTYNKDLKVPVFYHDADIIFRKLPNFARMCIGDVVYESDTVSYVGAQYLRYKAREAGLEEDFVLNELADLVSLDKHIIILNNSNSGGAQYLLKGIDYRFWEEVEHDCLKIRDYLMNTINKKYFPSESAGYQSWCSDMWAVNFNLWKRGIPTAVTPELAFSWATDELKTYEEKNIFHNAGVVPSMRNKIFYKGDYTNRSPLGQDFSHLDKKYAGYKYSELLTKIK
jgi:hypothetical protein